MSTTGAPLDDALVFLEESACPDRLSGRPGWRVLIVDDDRDVHSATTFALSNLEMQGRPLEFLHAYSAEQARELLARESNVAVVLLDVVMEGGDSGLQLARDIREKLQLAEVRIILRTGQPGYAPELEAIRDYDINDYKTKSELTRIKLYTTVTAAIRSYEQIMTINAGRRGLDRIVHASHALMGLHELDEYAAEVLNQIGRLLGAPSNGLVCVQEHPNPDGPLVLAASGRYTPLLATYLHRSCHTDAVRALQQVLDLRRSVFTGPQIALHLGGSPARSFLALFEAGRPLDDIEHGLLEVFCRNVAVGLDNVLLMTRLHNAAFYDPLTKLPNRVRLRELIGEALDARAQTETTLALVDIDHFAETNDALGHQFGDMLLLGVASRLSARFGDCMTVARVGGDTFGVLGHAAQLNPAVLLDQFDAPFRIDGQEVQVTATAGLVRLADYEGGPSDALKDADIALKRAKLLQRSGHFYFSRSMGTDVRERVRLMHALRSACEQNELFVVYQPQIDLATRRPVGAEALLRWKTRDGSFVPPDRFIPIAEYSGLIIDIGEQVMRAACTELVHLQSLGFADFTISINVSQVQFRHPRFLDTLRAVLADTEAPANRIELEITESIAMEDPDKLIRLLGEVRQTGVMIAIDDFGTGFSSLSYLQRLRADRLKIDRSFVTEITDSARGSSIAEMVIQLGRNLGMSVVAEGVEDERQAQILSGLGCPYAQGYLFALPMTVEQLPGWLRDNGAR